MVLQSMSTTGIQDVYFLLSQSASSHRNTGSELYAVPEQGSSTFSCETWHMLADCMARRLRRRAFLRAFCVSETYAVLRACKFESSVK
jgi:hypothetical protein